VLYPHATGCPQADDLEEISLGVLRGFVFIFVGIYLGFQNSLPHQIRTFTFCRSVIDFPPNRFETLDEFCLTEIDLAYCPLHYLFNDDLRCSNVLIDEENPEHKAAFDFGPQPYGWKNHREGICDVAYHLRAAVR
jgi:hypothetical protein